MRSVVPSQFSEIVSILAYDGDKLVPDETRTATLAEAVKIVVEQWSGEQLADVFIATEFGAIEGIDAVRTIYFSDDFPLPRKVSKDAD